MKEAQFGARVSRALDTSTDRLSYRVSQKLAASREAALSRASQTQTASSVAHSLAGSTTFSPSGRMVTGGRLAGGGVAMAHLGDFGSPPRSAWMWRLTGAILPVLIVLAGLVSISYWDDDAKAEELADVDTGVLTDDVPLDTLTDRGFGVFLTNSRQ